MIVEGANKGHFSINLKIGDWTHTVTVGAVEEIPTITGNPVLNGLLASRALKSVAANVGPETAASSFTDFSGAATSTQLIELFKTLEKVTVTRAAQLFANGKLPDHLSTMFKELMQKALQVALVPVAEREAQDRLQAAKAADQKRYRQDRLKDVMASGDQDATARAMLQSNQEELEAVKTKMLAEEAEFNAKKHLADQVADQAIQLMKDEIKEDDADKLTPEQKKIALSYRPGNQQADVKTAVRGRYVKRQPDPINAAAEKIRKDFLPGLPDTLDGLKSTVSDLEEMQTLLLEFLEGQDRGARAGVTDEAKTSSDSFDMAALLRDLAYLDENECVVCVSDTGERVCVTPTCTGKVCEKCTEKLKQDPVSFRKGCPCCRQPFLV